MLLNTTIRHALHTISNQFNCCRTVCNVIVCLSPHDCNVAAEWSLCTLPCFPPVCAEVWWLRRCHGEIDGDLNDERLRRVVVLWYCVELSMGLREILQCLEKAPIIAPCWKCRLVLSISRIFEDTMLNRRLNRMSIQSYYHIANQTRRGPLWALKDPLPALLWRQLPPAVSPPRSTATRLRSGAAIIWPETSHSHPHN